MTTQASAFANPRPVLREVQALVPLALPLILGQLFGIGTDVIISIVAGHIGADVMAAVALGSSLWIVVFMAVVGLMMSLQPAVSTLDGAGRGHEAGHLLAQGLMLGLLAGTLAGLLLALAGPAFARETGMPRAILSGVDAFLHGAAWSLPALGVLAACRGVSEGLSMTRPTMICGGLGLIALGPSAYGLMHGIVLPAMGPMGGFGAEGAGFAIAVIFWLQAVAYLGWIRMSGRYPADAWRGRAWAPDLRVLARLVRVGAPIAVTIVLEVCMFSVATLMAGRFGAVAVAGHQVALMTSAVFFMVPLGLSLAVTVRVGRAVGQRDPVAVRRAGLAGFTVMLVAQGISAVAMFSASGTIAGLFTQVPPVVTLASTLLTIAAFFQFADGTQCVAMAALRGLQDTRVPMLLAMLSYWLLGVPLGAWLAFDRGFGVPGIWIGLMAGLTVAAILLTTRFLCRTALPAGR
ncbi:MAG: MATE family efflux transporter [Proteobacteria bacterium]|nr:MATE family efflux transporter [Pseudomonadota bacterium]